MSYSQRNIPLSLFSLVFHVDLLYIFSLWLVFPQHGANSSISCSTFTLAVQFIICQIVPFASVMLMLQPILSARVIPCSRSTTFSYVSWMSHSAPHHSSSSLRFSSPCQIAFSLLSSPAQLAQLMLYQTPFICHTHSHDRPTPPPPTVQITVKMFVTCRLHGH